jgi:hypothetical protein
MISASRQVSDAMLELCGELVAVAPSEKKAKASPKKPKKTSAAQGGNGAAGDEDVEGDELVGEELADDAEEVTLACSAAAR